MLLVRMLSIAVLQKSSAKDFRSFLKKHICLWGIFITAKMGDNSDRLLIPWDIKLFTSSSAVPHELLIELGQKFTVTLSHDA